MTDPEHSPRPVREVIRPTTIIEAVRLARRLGVALTIASETFQHTGSFKFRAGYNIVIQVPQRHLITASSGNFGQALACACQRLGKLPPLSAPGIDGCIGRPGITSEG